MRHRQAPPEESLTTATKRCVDWWSSSKLRDITYLLLCLTIFHLSIGVDKTDSNKCKMKLAVNTRHGSREKQE